LKSISEVKVDVLVIGAGGAGLRAAIAACEKGANTLVVSKGPVGRSGATAVAGWGLQAAFGHIDAHDSPQQHFYDTIREGKGLAEQNLVKVLAENSPARVLDLEKYQVKIKKSDDEQKYVQLAGPGETYPRSVILKEEGKGLISGLKRQCKKLNIPIVEDIIIYRLFRNEENICGAIGINLRDGSFLLINSPSIILATGGNCGLWSITDNPPNNIGDGFYLAYQAGVELVDMEMVLFYPTVVLYPLAAQGVLIDYEACLHPDICRGKLLNAHGQEFIFENSLPTRDVLVRLISQEIKKGLGTDRGGVYLDLSCSPKSPKDIENNLYELMGSVFKYLKNMDIDLVKEKIEVAPAAHYTLGGIRINERCETNILGLFAAGEASGNLHGANRLSGNALAETQVFGKIAGETAAEYARKNPEITLNKNDVLEALEEVESIFVAREKGVKPVEVKRKIKGIMTDYLGFGREEKGLKTALDLLEKIAKEDINSLRLTGNKVFNLDLINALECIFMVDVAKMIVLSALQRQESIGHHYRIDFPENKTCNNQEHTLLKKVQNKIIVKKIPVDKTQWGDIYARENDRY